MGEFYAHPAGRDGRDTKCKECAKAMINFNRQANIDYYRAYDRDRGNRLGLEGLRNYRARNRNKVKAHGAVSYAVSKGRLVTAPCMICGRTDSHAHHDNYDRPLDVTWLCPVHLQSCGQ